MIDAKDMLRVASDLGYRWYAGVPCSLIGGLIDTLAADPTLTYVCAANEGDAVAAASGAWLGGRRSVAFLQNSGLGNAVSPLTSLNAVFNIPVLLLITLRGEPGLPDEPQHSLMGRITPELLTAMEIPWDYFPHTPVALAPALVRAHRSMTEIGRPYALLVRKGTFAGTAVPHGATLLRPAPRSIPLCVWQPATARRYTRRQVLERVLALTRERDTVLIASTGYISRELYALADRAQHFYVVGSMGCASSLALGLALARPDLRVVVLDGDGAALMRLGNLATIGCYRPRNLIHLVLDNEMHESTGGQATAASRMSLAEVAAACGYAQVWVGDRIAMLDHVLALGRDAGPVFAHVKITPGAPENLPRPAVTPVEIRLRFMEHIGRTGSEHAAQAVAT